MNEIIELIAANVFKLSTLLTFVAIMWQLKSISRRLALMELPRHDTRECACASFVEHQTEVNAAVGEELARLDERIEGVPRGGPFR